MNRKISFIFPLIALVGVARAATFVNDVTITADSSHDAILDLRSFGAPSNPGLTIGFTETLGVGIGDFTLHRDLATWQWQINSANSNNDGVAMRLGTDSMGTRTFEVVTNDWGSIVQLQAVRDGSPSVSLRQDTVGKSVHLDTDGLSATSDWSDSVRLQVGNATDRASSLTLSRIIGFDASRASISLEAARAQNPASATIKLFDPINGTEKIVIDSGNTGLATQPAITINGQPVATVSAPLLTPARLAVGPYGSVEYSVEGGPTELRGLLAVNGYASGINSVALGRYSWASAESAFAIGEGSMAQGDRSIALAYGKSDGPSSIAAGYDASSHGIESMAFGRSAVAFGSNSMAFGSFSDAHGIYSLALGQGSRANSAGSVAIGQGSSDGSSSVSIMGYAGGANSLGAMSGAAMANSSVAIGYFTSALIPNQIALGYLNDSGATTVRTTTAPEDLLFMIGNGWIDDTGEEVIYNKSNALAVARNGNTSVQGAVTVEGGPATAPVKSVFKRDVSVRGVLRVPPAGDIGMGAFTNGELP